LCCACLEPLTVPFVLSCGHKVCSNCTQKITIQKNTASNNNLEKSLLCPLCHALTLLQELKISETQVIKGIHPKLTVSVPHLCNLLDVLCDHCENAPATCECSGCSKPGVYILFFFPLILMFSLFVQNLYDYVMNALQ
jgi:hypothetical protein